MNREIVFKAWLWKHLKIVDVIRIDFEAQEITYQEIDFEYEDVIREKTALFKDISLLEYTGIKDKNGVKIFEGDIMKSLGYPAIKVIFDKESCSFKMKVQYKGWEDLLILSSNKTPHLEVIGNIYENKGLLDE